LQQLDDNSAQPSGGAAGAKSHNFQGGQIVGLLGATKLEMVRALTAGQKEEFKALADLPELARRKVGSDLLAGRQRQQPIWDAMITAKVVVREHAARSKFRAAEVCRSERDH
jgi:hypothetical protein